MDVIAPQLLWIKGICYRINPSADIADNYENKNTAEHISTGIESLQV